MATIRTTEKGIEYLIDTLKEGKQVVTGIMFWKIPHNTPVEDICLKLGRYNRNNFLLESVESISPRSELTLNNGEFQKLVEFLKENYEPFKNGVREYIAIDDGFDQSNITNLKAVFNDPDKQKLL